MFTNDRKIDKIKEKINPLLKKNKVKRAGIFGSYSRGEQKRNSDIDILVEMDGSLIDLIRLENELKKVLRKKIDLLTYKSVHPALKERILGEEIKII